MNPANNYLHQLVGSMSVGAAGNPTVAMFDAAFSHHQLHWRYINMEVQPPHLAAAVAGARAMGFEGFNCSMPHKVAVIAHLDELGESARAIGAVNCIVRRGEALVGENTDGKGFLRSLESVVDPRGKSVVMFGAGGAARAVAVELGLAGARKITIVNRSRARGTELAGLLGEKLALEVELVSWEGQYRLPERTDVLINATSIGLYDAEARLAVDSDSFAPGLIVADVVFSPPQTRLIRDAQARGCIALDGLGMLVNQAVICFKYWTGLEPDAAVMRQALG